MRAFLFISFFLACIASCASQKDMVHLNKQVNALYRQVKEDGEKQEKVIGEIEEILKEHEDARWEFSAAIDVLTYKESKLEGLIEGQLSKQSEFERKQSEFERQLKVNQELQESARTQLEEMLKASNTEQEANQRRLEETLKASNTEQEANQRRLEEMLKASNTEQEANQRRLEEMLKASNTEQEANQRRLEEMLKASNTEQEAERRKSLGAVINDLDSLRTIIAQLQADFLGVKENIQTLTGQIEESNFLIRGVIEKDTTKTDAMVSQLNELSLITEDFRSRLEILETYVNGEIEAKKERALITEDYRSRLEILETYVRGEIEAKKQRALKEKLSTSEQKGETATPAQPQRELTESELYDRALGYHRDGKHQEAMADFNAFLKKYPKSDLADNAQFWIGESYKAQGKYEEAILAFQKVVDGYPGGNKVPAALLHQGYAFEKIGDTTTAELVFKKLVKDFPKTDEAEIARKRLQGVQ